MIFSESRVPVERFFQSLEDYDGALSAPKARSTEKCKLCQ